MGIIGFLIVLSLYWGVYSNNNAKLESKPKPFLYNISHLEALKERGLSDPAIEKFLKRTNRILTIEPLTVVDSNLLFSSNPHDYCSIAPYSWPAVSEGEAPYITIDGVVNPERDNYDRLKLKEFANRLQQLSVAYYITERIDYYDSFVTNLKAWFTDSLTYMAPNFEYAQVVKGKNHNKGAPYGLVEMEDFTRVIESFYLINSVKLIDKDISESLQLWFSSFLDWVINSPQWQKQSKTNNNIVTGCNVTMLEMALFTGKKTLARQVARDNMKSILMQIDDEGKQSAELRRTKAFDYSVYNLKKIIDFALIMEQLGVGFYKINQRKIDSAFEYLLQFEGNHDAFPYKQINSWEGHEKQLRKNISRLVRVSSRKSLVIKMAKDLSEKDPQSIVSYVY